MKLPSEPVSIEEDEPCPGRQTEGGHKPPIGEFKLHPLPMRRRRPLYRNQPWRGKRRARIARQHSRFR